MSMQKKLHSEPQIGAHSAVPEISTSLMFNEFSECFVGLNFFAIAETTSSSGGCFSPLVDELLLHSTKKSCCCKGEDKRDWGV